MNGEEKIIILQKICREYLFINNDSCRKYGNETILLSQFLVDKENEALAYKKIGFSYYMIGDYDSSLRYYKESKNLFDEVNIPLELAIVTNLIGDVYRKKTNYPKAISSFIEAKKLCDSLINVDSIQTSVTRLYSILYTNMGLLYFQMDSLNIPLEYFDKALVYAYEINDSTRISASYSNIGMIYKAKKEFDLALLQYQKSLAISQKIGNRGYEQATLNNIANIYSQIGLSDSAFNYFQKALYIANKKGDKYGLSLINRNIADIYLIKQKYDDALNTSIKALEYSLGTGATEEVYLNYELLSRVYKQKGNYDSAYYYYVKHSVLKDSVKNVKTRAEVAEIQSKYESDKKEKENTLLKKDIEFEKGKSYYLMLITIILLLSGIISLLLFYFIRKNTITKKQLAESEAAGLKAKLESQKRELALGTLTVSRNLEFINSLIDELKELTNYVSEDGLQPLSNIVRKLTHQQSDNGWKEFEKRFSEIHSDFYSRLIMEYPDLTQNEVKLSAFLKLGMNTKEICSITFQSVRAVEAARLRLRKKLDLETGDNLSIFLQSY